MVDKFCLASLYFECIKLPNELVTHYFRQCIYHYEVINLKGCNLSYIVYATNKELLQGVLNCRVLCNDLITLINILKNLAEPLKSTFN